MILDLEGALLGEYSPLRLALLAYLFHPGVGAFTCVLDSSGRERCEKGFVQVRNRPGCPEWHVVHIAPALDEVGDPLTTWHRLLTGMSRIAADEGVLRIFARPVRDDLVEGVLEQAGFQVYAREMIYRIGDSSVPTWRRDSRRDLDTFIKTGHHLMLLHFHPCRGMLHHQRACCHKLKSLTPQQCREVSLITPHRPIDWQR